MTHGVITFAVQGEYVSFSPRGLASKGGRRGFQRVKKVMNVNPQTGEVIYKTEIIDTPSKGRITGFSRRSRSRFNSRIAMLKKSKEYLPLFVTLTYHNDFSFNFEDYKRDFSNFIKRLRRRYSHVEIENGKEVIKYDFGMIWKLEFQKRGAPHFHMMLWGVPLSDRDDIVVMWHDIVAPDDDDHLYFHLGLLRDSEHCVQPVRSWNGVKSYCSKYLSKEFENISGYIGRVWGLVGSLPFSKLLTFRINMNDALKFREFVAYHHKFEFKRLGFWASIYHDDLFFTLRDFVYDVDIPAPSDDYDWDLQEVCF